MKKINKFDNLIQDMLKKIFLALLIIIGGILMAGQLVFADSTTTLTVIPTTATTTAGESFEIGVKILPGSEKVCVVKGTINFENLSCKSVKLADGVMAQTVPTCEIPSFTLGIPKCTLSDSNLFSVTAEGIDAGSANLMFVNTKVIGVGVDIPFDMQNGLYDILAATEEPTDATIDDTFETDDNYEGDIYFDDSILDSLNNDTATSSVSTSTKDVPSKISGLTASAFEAVNSAYNFVKGKAVTILILLIILMIINQVYMAYKINKKEE